MNKPYTQHLLILINCLAILPLLFLAYFNYPTADDFSYAVNPNNLNFIEHNIDRYLNWTSRYFATSVLISSPIAHGIINYFWVYPILFVVLFHFSMRYLLNALKIKTVYSNHLLSASLLSIYIMVVPSLTENFFWLAGSVTYFLPSIAFLCLIATSINIFHQKKTSDIVLLFFSLFVIGGCVEILVGFAGIFLLGINCFYYLKNKKISIHLLLALAFIGLLMLLIVFSPGNQKREGIIQTDMNLLNVVFFSIKKIVTIGIRYLLIPFVLFIAIHPVLKIKSLLHQKVNLIYLIIGIGFLIFSGSFITIYSLRILPPPRVENVLVFSALILVFLIANQTFHRFKISNSVLIALVIATFLIQFLLPLSVFHEKSNLPLIYADIFSGKVFQYEQEMKEREVLLLNCIKQCEVPAIQHKPMSIFFKDFSEDPNHFINKSQAQFYDLEFIKLKE